MNADVVVGRVQGDQLGSAKTELNNLLAAVQVCCEVILPYFSAVLA